MGASVGPAQGDDEVNSTINTTPLVDVMLVLLIIFLITIPVVTKTIELELPIISNEATQTKPENIVIQIDRDGKIYWNDFIVAPESLVERMKAAAVQVPQPEVHIRGDQQARYEFIGRVVASAQRGGIMKVGFITDPEIRAVAE
jgi:biopolymer transport protein ExbD